MKTRWTSQYYNKKPLYIPNSANQISETKYKRDCKIYTDVSTGNIFFYLNFSGRHAFILTMHESELEKILKFKEVWQGIALSPKKNEASLKISEELGWKLDEERSFYNGLVFGIYRKDLTR